VALAQEHLAVANITPSALLAQAPTAKAAHSGWRADKRIAATRLSARHPLSDQPDGLSVI
jgi:hypothetical protein